MGFGWGLGTGVALALAILDGQWWFLAVVLGVGGVYFFRSNDSL